MCTQDNVSLEPVYFIGLLQLKTGTCGQMYTGYQTNTASKHNTPLTKIKYEPKNIETFDHFSRPMPIQKRFWNRS